MPRADRFPKYFDHALRCREQNLPNTADFIHKIGKAADMYKEALEFCIGALAEYESDLKRPKACRQRATLPHSCLALWIRAVQLCRSTEMTWFQIKGERRDFMRQPSIIIDHDMTKEEAERMLIELKSEMPLWDFFIEEQEFIDEVQEGICA
jgi:hypothetical protein